ncbi:MAG: toprim domain-containing protein [Candidatus Thorarchaeota archaeon]
MLYNYVKLLQDFHIEYDDEIAWNRKFIAVKCPFCGSTHLTGGINVLHNYYNCWKCKGHDIQIYIRIITGLEWNDLKNNYILDDSFAQIENKKIFSEKVELPESTNLNDKARKYLLKRGFDPDELIDNYHILSTNHLGSYNFRIIIPIYFMNELISFTSRDYTEQAKLRYKSCPKKDEVIHHKDILYGIDGVNSDTIIVVEGPMDKWKLGKNAIATLGIGYRETQVKLLLNFKKIILLFDHGKDAQQMALKMANTLSLAGREVENIKLSKGDPGDFTYNQSLYLLKKLGVRYK